MNMWTVGFLNNLEINILFTKCCSSTIFCSNFHLHPLHWILNHRFSTCLCRRLNSRKYFKSEHFIPKKMIIFETLIKDLITLGVNPNDSNRFNWRIRFGFFVFGLCISLNVIFIFTIENDNVMVYMKIFCVITGLIQMCICLLATVFQEDKVFSVIKSTENIMNKSKSFYLS